MRAQEILGVTTASSQLGSEPASEIRVDPRFRGKRLTLGLLHNMRIQRDLRNAELDAQKEFVQLMYAPQPHDAKKPTARRLRAKRSSDVKHDVPRNPEDSDVV
jgi:hypothetical protein